MRVVPELSHWGPWELGVYKPTFWLSEPGASNQCDPWAGEQPQRPCSLWHRWEQAWDPRSLTLEPQLLGLQGQRFCPPRTFWDSERDALSPGLALARRCRQHASFIAFLCGLPLSWLRYSPSSSFSNLPSPPLGGTFDATRLGPEHNQGVLFGPQKLTSAAWSPCLGLHLHWLPGRSRHRGVDLSSSLPIWPRPLCPPPPTSGLTAATPPSTSVLTNTPPDFRFPVFMAKLLLVTDTQPLSPALSFYVNWMLVLI